MRTQIRRRPALWASIMVAGWLALTVVACGSDGDTRAGGATPSSPPTIASTFPVTSTPNPVLCADAAALRASVDKLTAVTLQAGLADELEADLKDVRTKLTTLMNDARGELQDETTALQSALTTLQTTVDDLAANPSTASVSAVTAAFQQVRTAGGDLLEAVATRCPSASPSPSG